MRYSLPSLLWVLTSFQLGAQSPVLNYALPSGAAPGKTTTITLFGDNLAGATELWTSFPGQTALDPDPAQGESSKPRYRLTVPSNVPVGIGAVRVSTTNGVSSLGLFMIDDLPSVVESGTNKTIKTAQELSLPIAVDGTCEELSFDYYQLIVTNGQRISAEAVAQRLGSQLDPVLRLLDSAGRELAYCDDASGAGSDARFSYTVSSPGKYFIELRDTRYQGGSKYRYRLRVGDFPLAKLPYLPVTQSGFKSEIGDTSPEKAELEPNDTSATATKVSVPTVVSGHFEKSKDRDFYQFETQKDQRLAFIGKSRTAGFPCDLFMQIYTSDGSLLTEANVTGASDAGFTNTFRETGTFRLLVEELNREGGPELGYRVEIKPYEPGFALTVENDKVEASAGGTFDIKVSCARREYNGPIMLALTGPVESFDLKSPLLPGRTNEVQLKVSMPANLKPGEIVHFGVVGYAKIGSSFFETQASTMPAIRKLFPLMLYPPPELDGWIGLGVKPAQKPAEPSSVAGPPKT